MIVRETVSHVPQDGALPHAPDSQPPALQPPALQPESHELPPHSLVLHELVPQGLQLDAHGAEQHRLTR